MITISITPEFKTMVSPYLLERAAKVVLEMEAIDLKSDLTILIDNDQRIQKLNFQFLGIDAPTDVLSFPSDEIDPETQSEYLGDIIISYTQACIQADVVGESINDEMQLLVVHGVLHLLGFDHAEPEEKEQMWNAQQAALTKLGCKIQHLPE
jgi:probable rRNA maturation factor